MRVFIAVDLPAGVKKDAGKIREKLMESGADVKWMEPEKFHFTLKFIGEIADKKINLLADKMAEQLIDENSFKVVLDSIGAFPDLEKMRVIWLGVSRGEAELNKLAQKAEQAALAVGAEAERRPFSGHLTLGRVRSFNGTSELKKIIKVSEKIEPLVFPVEGVKIIQSILKPAGSEYTVLKEIKIGRCP